MGEQVMGFIKDEISKSRYFLVSVDSTLGITHCDQLTIILCYINMVDYQPVERFLTFINISSQTGQNLADTLAQYFSDQDIDYKNCRGQTYDNASNMSGKYIGMQQILKNKNSLVDYIPCAAHSLNLVSQSAVDCCVEAVSFFNILNHQYTFFVTSTHRWDVMMTHGKNQPECFVPKYPSNTRWSAQSDAAKAVFKGYHQLQSALQAIVSIKLLQSSTIKLTPAFGLLKTLHIFLDECREKFDDYNQKAGDCCGNSTYKSESRRQPKSKRQINDGDTADDMEGMPSQQNFKVNTFYVIIDQLKNALKKRTKAYSIVLQRFGVLTEYDSMTDEDIDIAVKGMVTVYSKDLCSDFPTEFRQFMCWYKEERNYEEGSSAQNQVDSSAQKMFKMLHNSDVYQAFPNTEIAIRIYLCLMSTNCSGERSFFQLKRIKDAKRSTMAQRRLSVLSLLCIESDLLNKVNFKELIDKFAVIKARKF
ncbi:zinc finger MYM-type protein 1-like [Hydra vulgaris]|uniref:Zinc finger MYM-type protein 1-like n=1 Tax=Hydra vulgaris TaxID=6087 RepID=A0ABM4DI73_HYDVU